MKKGLAAHGGSTAAPGAAPARLHTAGPEPYAATRLPERRRSACTACGACAEVCRRGAPVLAG